MLSRSQLTALFLLLVSPGPVSAGGAAPPLILDRTYTGAGFTLGYPRAYTVRSFVGGLALTAPGRGDVLTASVLPRPANARTLSAEAYARQFAPLNVQGAGELLRFSRLTLPGGRPAWVGTWRGARGTPVGPLALVPLDPGAQNWLMMSAAGPSDLPLLDAVTRSVRTGR
ncbi:hypothetical protein [Deinococcus apachensis]|uniref:hypothetical protein n=1 Tax=Deinococcus apachensis TaxID=309886 RepID=UPI00036B669E|nr:hypothetical protein [Deinococcus apachensis]